MRLLILSFSLLLSTPLLAQLKFIHTTGPKNNNGNSTYLTAEGLNNNAKAIIIVEADDNARKLNPHPVGVWYNSGQWAIFNQDLAAMPEGVSFIITWNNPDVNSFYQKSSKANLSNGKMFIDNSSLNNNPSAAFYVSQVWNPEGLGGIYNNSDITVEFDKQTGKWAVVNINGGSILDGTAFNILITGLAGNAKNNPDNSIKDLKNADINNKPVNTVINDKELKNIDIINKPVNPVTNNPVTNVPIDVLANADIIAKAAFGTNFGFENQLFNWTATGTAFNNQPVEGNTVTSERVLLNMQYNRGGIGGDYWKGMVYPIGIKDNNWIGTYEKGNGDAPNGTLTSSPVKIVNRYLHFLLGGGKDINNLYVELQVKKEDYETAWGAGKRSFYGETNDGFFRVNRITSLLNSEELFRYWFDLDAELNHNFLNKTIRIAIVDNSSRSWGHINADDFQQSASVSDFIYITRDGFGLYADNDKPVWGYFDSHAHPAADEAFGKNYYVGSSKTPLNTTWSNEVCTRSHTWGRTLDGFTNTFDPHRFFDGGWPDMWGYPRFNGKMHQKYQVDLIKRAWQGGLKIFCALGINNMYLATRALGHNTNGEAIDDESVLLRQIAVTKDLVRENSDWMEIAYTSRDARRIIMEGKLCVVLGAESDVFGNFKSPDCTWGDRGEDRPLVTITEADAEDKLERKLNEYYDLGLRQILPLHYLSKPFGGTAVFNGNTFLPHISFYDHVRVKTGVPDRIGFSLYEDFPTGPAFVGNFMTYAAYAARIWKQDEGAEISMVNADGLTPIGNMLFRKLMQKKFIIDQEHASYQSKRDIFRIASDNDNYPVMASHCTPEGLSFIWTGAPVRYNGGNQDKLRNFNTSTIRFVAHEMELNDESYDGIRTTQGTVGVFTLLNHKQKYSGRWGDIINDCPGSTKTMAQMYCYSLDKMNGKGVGLASDLPMVDAVCPRFGPFAAWAMTVENEGTLKNQQRTAYRMRQQNGVRYDVPSLSYHHELFNNGQIDGFEEDVWKALAAWEAGANAVTNESTVSESGDPLHRGRIRNMVKGLNFSLQGQIMGPGAFTGDAPWEQAAMFCLKNNISTLDLSVFDDGGKRETAVVYNKILPIWNLWKEKNGNNEPLRRYISGNRYWDFNLDGLAHYGLMPDMLQDLKNIGFTNLQLIPLFSSAEDYIKMWEKIEHRH